jgi:hypothetical protein
MVLVGVAMLVGVRLAAETFLPGEGHLALIGMVPLAVGLWGALLVARHEHLRMAQLFAGGAVLFSTLLFAVGAPRVARHQHAPDLLATARELSYQPQLGFFRTLEPSWVYYSEQALDSVALPNEVDAMEHELTFAEGRWQRIPKRSAAEYFSAPGRFVITTRQEWETVQASLPPDVMVLGEAPYFLKPKHQLLLIGRAAATAHASAESAQKRR